MRIKFRFTLPIIVSLFSFWIWRVFANSIFLGIILVVASLAIFYKRFFLSLFLFLLLSGLVFNQAYDKSIFTTSSLENYTLENREVYFVRDFGKFYTNRFGIFLHKNVSYPLFKIQKNLFYNFDPNQYFFAGHPRERADGLEFEKFSFLFLPFFLIGLFISLEKFTKREALLIAGIIFLSTFFNPGYSLGSLLFFPLLVCLISLGIERVIIWLKDI